MGLKVPFHPRRAVRPPRKTPYCPASCLDGKMSQMWAVSCAGLEPSELLLAGLRLSTILESPDFKSGLEKG